ncbi:uncharacterized protein G2W53_030537 [Senna tora]|uniref:Uncharacterized protein n=1 Tax=Senna tora TaxID=362788 RepID=A0A834T7E8_9FABA|nr:uncharacterized protein G2W53_030537 [Senna tora]
MYAICVSYFSVANVINFNRDHGYLLEHYLRTKRTQVILKQQYFTDIVQSQNVTDRAAILVDFVLFKDPEIASSIFRSNSLEKSLFCSACIKTSRYVAYAYLVHFFSAKKNANTNEVRELAKRDTPPEKEAATHLQHALLKSAT